MNSMHLQPDTYFDPESGICGWRLKFRDGRAIPTPAFHDGKLYVAGGFGSYDFYRVDARSGAIDWHHRCPDDGPTAPVVSRDRVFYNTESCTLEALDVEGTPLWRHWLGDPLLAQSASARDSVFVVYPKGGVHHLGAFAAKDGRPLWVHEVGGDVISAPIVANGHVYLATFDGVVRCVDVETGSLWWSRDMRATSAPWIHGDQVYVSHREEGVYQEGYTTSFQERTSRIDARGRADKAYEAKGAPYLDREHGSARKSTIGGAADSSVGFGSAPGAAKLEQAAGLIGEDKVSRAWRFQGSRPVVAEGLVFDTTGDRLEAREIESGKLKWEWSDGVAIEGERKLTPPVVTGRNVWVGTWDGRLLSWDALTGRLRWQARLPAPCHWQPIVADGWVYAGLEDGSLIALNTDESPDAMWTAWGGGSGHNGIESSERRRRSSMFELPLRQINSHIVADVDGMTFVVDTGSPLSFGLDSNEAAIQALETLSPDFRAHPLLNNVLGVIRSAIYQHVSDDIAGVLGMDVLSLFDSRFSLPRGILTLCRPGQLHGGDFELPLESFNGIPLVGPVVIAGQRVSALWDTGATTGYLAEPGLLEGSQYIEDRDDFHPLSDPGTFRIRVHSVPVELSPHGGLINLSMALLPTWSISLGQHILGSELLNHFEVSLCLRDEVVRFTRHDNVT
ncbi:MAG: PQQ-binding-like beta-propeller repeat protein [Woeseia sp.]